MEYRRVCWHCFAFLVGLVWIYPSVSQEKVFIDNQIEQLVLDSVVPYEGELEALFGGAKSFAKGFAEEFRSVSDCPATVEQIKKYLPNLILRELYNRGYCNESLGQYTAAMFLESIHYRKWIEERYFSSTNLPQKIELLGRFKEKILELLNEYHLSTQNPMVQEIIRMINRNRCALEDISFLNGPFLVDDGSIGKILSEFRSILSDLSNEEISNRELNEKYHDIVHYNEQFDRQDIPKEILFQIRLKGLPALFDQTIEKLCPPLVEMERNDPAFQEKMSTYKKRLNELCEKTQEFEMKVFGQTIRIPRSTKMKQDIDTYFSGF